MQNPIVMDPQGVTLLGGGKFSRSTLKEALTLAPRLVAADGAARAALAQDIVPDAVIGDFDSLDAATRAVLPKARLHHIPEQDSTDFEKCLSRVAAPLIMGIGFTGRRADHELAVYNTLSRYPDKRVVLLSKHDVCFLAPRALTLDLTPGARVSLFPMRPVQGSSTGLKYPIDGIAFAPGGRIGTSNEATQSRVVMEFDTDAMLVFLSRDNLGPALDALGV